MALRKRVLQVNDQAFLDEILCASFYVSNFYLLGQKIHVCSKLFWIIFKLTIKSISVFQKCPFCQ